MYKSWTCIFGEIFFLLSRGSGEMQTKNPEKWASTKIRVFRPSFFAFGFSTARIQRFQKGVVPVFPNIRIHSEFLHPVTPTVP